MACFAKNDAKTPDLVLLWNSFYDYIMGPPWPCKAGLAILPWNDVERGYFHVASLISSDIDFEAEGKHTGYLRLPHFVHRSAYGRILIPIVMIGNGKRPTVFLMSGNHGDEYEVQIALTKLCQELEASDIQGRLIIMTMANYPAVAGVNPQCTRRWAGRVERGDCLFQVGSDLE